MRIPYTTGVLKVRSYKAEVGLSFDICGASVLYACFESGNKTRFWANKISLTPPLIIELFVPSPESERSCICVLVILILPSFTNFLFYLRIVPTALYFLFFIILIRNTILLL